MAVNISGLRRNLKNVAHNYTDAQVKVREATSNDPWGPSSTVMSEIADLTYNAVAFSEIMQMVWKRLNDHGKNWRHVYKALVLLEYLIKTGSDKVAQQCKENIFAIQTLKDFQYFEDNKDQGINVREKAKALVSLLKDDERLKNERIRALKAKERFTQSTAGIGNDTIYNTSRDRFEGGGGSGSGGTPHPSGQQHYRQGGASPSNEFSSSELESARPQTAGEEELQLQLALAMSREEAEKEETKTKSDDMRLAIALQKSKIKGGSSESDANSKKPTNGGASSGGSALLDLVDINFEGATVATGSSGLPPSQPPPPLRTAASLDPWGFSATTMSNGSDPRHQIDAVLDDKSVAVVPFNDPWSPPAAQVTTTTTLPENGLKDNRDPWTDVGAVGGVGGSSSTMSKNNDPWAPASSSNTPLALTNAAPDTNGSNPLSAFDLLRNPNTTSSSSSMGYPSAQDISAVEGPSTSPSCMLSNSSNLLNPTTPNNESSSTTSGGELDLLSRLEEPSEPAMNNGSSGRPKKTVESLLNEHSNLVNLDNLISGSSGKSMVLNPFEQNTPNPFLAGKSPKPAMNQLLQNQSGWSQAAPAAPSGTSSSKPGDDFNPFF